jgi:hypothetical protein
MYLQIQQQSLLLGRRPRGFTEHYYTEWDDGLGKEKISLFLLLGINSTQVPGPELGKEAFQLLQDHFLDDLEGDPYVRFEAALREINLMVSEKEKELELKFIPNMSVLCGVLQKDVLFLSQRGEAQAYLLRNRHVSSISDGLCDPANKADLFQNIASGQLDIDDTVILSTGQLVQYVTPNDLSKIFSEQNLKEANKEMKDLLDSDLEQQMALFSFEVLEKVESLAPIEVLEEEELAEENLEEVESDDLNVIEENESEDEEVMEEYVDREEVIEEREEKIVHEKSSSNVPREKLEAGVNALRSMVDRRPRVDILGGLKKLPRKRLLQAIVLLVIVTAGGMTYLTLSTQQQGILDDLQAQLDMSQSQLDQAETRGSFDKVEASGLLHSAEDLALEVLASGQLGRQATELLDAVSLQRDFLDNVVRIDDELQLLVDFRGILGTSSIQGALPYEDQIVVYTENEAYEVLIDEAQSPTNIDSTERVLGGTYFSDRDTLVFLTESGNVIEYDQGNTQFADTNDVDWNQGVDIDPYGSRIYILDPEESQIWKYTRGSLGYGGASAYVDEDVDLSDAVSMAIDGGVWVLNSDGSLISLLSGEALDFDIEKPPLDPVEGAGVLYTELDISQLYILDPAESRLLTFTKSSRDNDLVYDSQFVFDDLIGTLQDFYWDKDRDVMVVVTDQALYELDF